MDPLNDYSNSMKKLLFAVLFCFSLLASAPAYGALLGEAVTDNLYCSNTDAVSWNGNANGSVITCDTLEDNAVGMVADVTAINILRSGIVENDLVSTTLCPDSVGYTTCRIIKSDTQDLSAVCGAVAYCSECITLIGANDYYESYIDYSFSSCSASTQWIAMPAVADLIASSTEYSGETFASMIFLIGIAVGIPIAISAIIWLMIVFSSANRVYRKK